MVGAAFLVVILSQAHGATLLGCATSKLNTWSNYSFASQAGTFTMTVDATPNAAVTDALIGLSAVPATAYTDLAAIVRFSSQKKAIDARNGSVYSAVQTIPYVAGKTYRIRIVVNVAKHVYSAYVTPPGGAEQTIGTNYAFRTEQTGVTSLGYWTPFSDIQTFQVCNWALTIPDTQPPSIPQNVTAVPVTSSEIKVSWGASTDNVGVVGYNVYQNGKLVVSAKNLNTSYTITGLVPPTTHTYTISAYDAAGNTSAQSTGATASIPASTITGTGSAYDKAILADHPVAFWDINPQAAGQNNTEIDLSGNGNTGTYKSGLPILATMPNGDHAADFNGSTQYLTVPSDNAFSIPTTGNLTWEAWIRPDTLQFPLSSSDGYVDFMGKCASYSPTCEWESRMYNANTTQGRSSRMSAYAFNPTAGLGAGGDWQPTSSLIAAGEWIHVVGEYTIQSQPSDCLNTSQYPGSINIWVNGVKWNQAAHGQTGCLSQYSVVPQAKNSPLDIGTMALDYWFKGAIGKVAIYNYLLSQAQITDHYEAMTGHMPTGSCGAICNF